MRNKVFFLKNKRTNERISERVNERANEKVTRFVIFAHFLFTDLGLPTFLAPNLVLNNTICSTAFIKKSELLWINTDCTRSLLAPSPCLTFHAPSFPAEPERIERLEEVKCEQIKERGRASYLSTT